MVSNAEPSNRDEMKLFLRAKCAEILGNMHKMEIKKVEDTTSATFARNSFIYDFLSSMRQKINDPLGVRAKKRKEINQR